MAATESFGQNPYNPVVEHIGLYEDIHTSLHPLWDAGIVLRENGATSFICGGEVYIEDTDIDEMTSWAVFIEQRTGRNHIISHEAVDVYPLGQQPFVPPPDEPFFYKRPALGAVLRLVMPEVIEPDYATRMASLRYFVQRMLPSDILTEDHVAFLQYAERAYTKAMDRPRKPSQPGGGLPYPGTIRRA